MHQEITYNNYNTRENSSHCFRILCVDDEISILNLYREILCAFDTKGQKQCKPNEEIEKRADEIGFSACEMTLCKSSAEAVDSVEKALKEDRPYALAFIDGRLPFGQNGIDTAQKIRSLDSYIELVIVMAYSDYNPLEISQHVPPSNKLLYIRKPLYTEEIQQIALALGTKWLTERTLREQEERYKHQLKSLVSELTLVEEKERRRIATDLHDSIGQTLALAKNKIAVLRDTIQEKTTVQELDDIFEDINYAVDLSRTLTYDLSPPVLYNFGLGAGIEWLLMQIKSQHNIHTHFQYGQLHLPLGEDMNILLYQSIRELLFNIVKHAEAKNIYVTIRKEDHAVILIEDDGIGFDLTQVNMDKSTGFGLFSIKERLDHLGGEFIISSEMGKGTQVMLRFSVDGGSE